jgi:hypothetical protein
LQGVEKWAGVLFLGLFGSPLFVEVELAFDVFQSASFVEGAREVGGTPVSSS